MIDANSKRILKGAAMVLFCAIFLTGCKVEDQLEDLTISDWNPDLAFPLVKGETTAEQLLGRIGQDDILEIRPDGIIQFIYRDEVFSVRGEEVMAIPAFDVPMLDTMVSIPLETGNGEELQRADLKSGQLVVVVPERNYPNVFLNIRIPDLIAGAVEFDTTLFLKETQSQEFKFDLNERMLRPGDDGLQLAYSAVRIPAGESIRLNGLVYRFANLVPTYAEGYLNQYPFDLSVDSFSVNIFESDWEGDIQFAEPVLRFQIDNSFGFPISADLSDLSIQTRRQGLVPVQSNDLEDISLNYPGFDEKGEFKATQLELNNMNSNITTLIDAIPQEVFYQIKGLSNPDLGQSRGYVQDSSIFRVEVALDLPLDGTISNFRLRDTVLMDWENIEEIRHLSFKTRFTNGFPIEGIAQVYFTDESYQVFDSLFMEGPYELASGIADANGKLSEPVLTENEIEVLQPGRLEALQAASHVVWEVRLATPPQAVKISQDNFVGLQISTLVGL
ncbi:MAG: hypothetical protein AAGI38_16225 [Bacteroidota bacterium]